MNWQKLSNKYPLAYKHMENNFDCLYTMSINITHSINGVKQPDKVRKIKHSLKRDLYDFFDEQGIYIAIEYDNWEYDFIWYVYINETGDYKAPETRIKARPQAETAAFTKAFEILNERLCKNATD